MFKKILFPTEPTLSFSSLLLLIMRICLGLLFLNHGMQKWLYYGELYNNFPDPLHIGSAWSLILIIISEVVCSFGLTTHVAKTIGRSKQADVCLNSTDSKLSGKHCIVEWDGQDLYLKDIGSTNGTSLNGSPIKPNTWHRLPNNIKVCLGEYEYRVSMEVI